MDTLLLLLLQKPSSAERYNTQGSLQHQRAYTG